MEANMSLTPSRMLPLGTPAPDFSLPDFDGKIHSLKDFTDDKALLVVFMCNHCPYVIHIKEFFAGLVKGYQEKGVAVVGINANDFEARPEDSPKYMKIDAEAFGYTFPYLVDESQEAAKAYQAACTPDLFLFDGDRKLVYRGQLDDSRPGNDIALTGGDLTRAVEAVLAGDTVPTEQKYSIGCNIKWKPGNEPDYFGE
jgi:peroxiredoxin